MYLTQTASLPLELPCLVMMNHWIVTQAPTGVSMPQSSAHCIHLFLVMQPTHKKAAHYNEDNIS
jgi:hypothetical protein